jgi:hypothetical protein
MQKALTIQIEARDQWRALCARLEWRCSACDLQPPYEGKDVFIVTGKCNDCFAREYKGARWD